MSTAERKPACFESLLDGPAAVAEAPPAAEAPAATVAPTAAVAAAVEETAPAAPETAMAEAAPAAAAAKTATPQPDADFGREYVEDDEEEDDRQDVTATVNEVSPDRYKRLHSYFANGQVWRELEARRFQYPKNEPFDVVISRGVLGDYQLRVGGKGRMTRIKRIK